MEKDNTPQEPNNSQKVPLTKPQWVPGFRGMTLTAFSEDGPTKYVRKWAACNEERLILAIKKYKSLKLRIRFDLWEEKEGKSGTYRLLSGRTLVFRKIPTIGMFWKIVEGLTKKSLDIVRGGGIE